MIRAVDIIEPLFSAECKSKMYQLWVLPCTSNVNEFAVICGMDYLEYLYVGDVYVIRAMMGVCLIMQRMCCLENDRVNNKNNLLFCSH